MNKQGVRIISLEAKTIYKSILENGESVGYVLPDKKNPIYFLLFKNVLDYSLDAIELEKAYLKEFNNKGFSFFDNKGKEYSLAIVNLKFNYKCEKNCGGKSLIELRKYFYQNGFVLNGKKYVRYKRSSGSSRQGKCLFIMQELYDRMAKWGECGLTATKDLASWEAYKALSLSDIKSTIKIPLNSILFVPDYDSIFTEEVVCVEEQNGKLTSCIKQAKIKNTIWDGESLLDESLFINEYIDKHMLLLRNKFFKSCAFKTKLQKWFKDKNITLESLKEKGFVTLATDISQILMVTTPSSAKFLNFLNKKLTQTNLKKWADKVQEDFGVVKYDKYTRYFDGDRVRANYQFINTLNLNEKQVQELLKPSQDYLHLIREDYDFMKYHFSKAFKRDKDECFEQEDFEKIDTLAERSDVIFALININYGFKNTTLYRNFRNDVIRSLKTDFKRGHVLLSGTNATLFGNGVEMLLALCGEFDLSKDNNPQALQQGEVACFKFKDQQCLVGARSPHITMGNLYYVKNNLKHEIWDYFDLGENIVCVNAIKENVQQRLNGCDYDSDTMLLTDEPIILEVVSKQYTKFKVPFCAVSQNNKEGQELYEIDYNTSENKIGEIVNLSQKLNSLLWDKINKNLCTQDEFDKIYSDICILAVLSGIEIDKAKRAYDNVDVDKELQDLRSIYGTDRPQFFKLGDDEDIQNRARNIKNEEQREEFRKEQQNKKSYTFYESAMEYLYKYACQINFRQGRSRKEIKMRIIDMIREPKKEELSTFYKKRDKVIELCNACKKELDGLYLELRNADDSERNIIYERIEDKKLECKQKVAELITEEKILYLVLKHFDKQETKENWQIYAPVLQSETFIKMLNHAKEKFATIIKEDCGEYDLFGLKFTKKWQ